MQKSITLFKDKVPTGNWEAVDTDEHEFSPFDSPKYSKINQQHCAVFNRFFVQDFLFIAVSICFLLLLGLLGRCCPISPPPLFFTELIFRDCFCAAEVAASLE